MNDPVVVNVLDRMGHGLNDEDSFRWGQAAERLDAQLQCLPIDVLHYDAGLALELAEVVQGCDVGVMKAGLYPRFIKEAVGHRRVVARAGQYLDSHNPAYLGMDGAVHFPHPTRAKVIQDPVFADGRPDHVHEYPRLSRDAWQPCIGPTCLLSLSPLNPCRT